MGTGKGQGEPAVSEFFAMGGYAAYVWPSFALTAIVMLANLYLALRARKKAIDTLRRSSSSDRSTSARSASQEK